MKPDGPVPVVTPDVKRVGRDMLVWLIGIATAIQSFARALEAFLHRQRDDFVLYFVATMALVLLAVTIERIKGFLEG